MESQSHLGSKANPRAWTSPRYPYLLPPPTPTADLYPPSGCYLTHKGVQLASSVVGTPTKTGQESYWTVLRMEMGTYQVKPPLV